MLTKFSMPGWTAARRRRAKLSRGCAGKENDYVFYHLSNGVRRKGVGSHTRASNHMPVILTWSFLRRSSYARDAHEMNDLELRGRIITLAFAGDEASLLLFTGSCTRNPEGTGIVLRGSVVPTNAMKTGPL